MQACAPRLFGARSLQAKDTATIGWPNDVGSWDPNQRFTPDAQAIFKAVFDQPLDQDPQLNLIPHLIKRWSLAPDGLSMAVELRDDVTFHDGDKMTTEDFRYTFFERTESGIKLDTANSWRKVQDIVIESPTKATMKFNSPAPTAPQWMAFLGSFVVPKKYIEAGGLENFLKKPVGTGPYKLAEYELNSRIVLERNDNYWGPKAKIARVTIEIIKDPSARVAAIQSGAGRLDGQCTGARGAALQGSRFCRSARADHAGDPAAGAQRPCVRRQERAARGSSRHRQSRTLQGLLRRRRGAAVGASDAGNARLSARFHVSATIPNSPSSIWPNPTSVPATR